MKSRDNNDDNECMKIINKKDYYDVLGIDKAAAEEDIRRAYKKLAIKFHPDKNKSTHASEAFKKVSHAFSVLSNKEKKANYDKYGTEEEIIQRSSRNQYGDDVDPFDLFNMFFGDIGIPRNDRGSSTQYIFRNGNVEYKVYSSNPRASRSYTFTSYGDDSDEDGESDGDINFGNDIFNHFFNKERRSHNRKSHSQRNETPNQNDSTTRNRNKRCSSSNDYGYRNRYNVSRLDDNFGLFNMLGGLLRILLIFFVLFAIVLPYILPRIFRFR